MRVFAAAATGGRVAFPCSRRPLNSRNPTTGVDSGRREASNEVQSVRPGWRMITLGIALQYLASGALGMAGYAFLENLGWAGPGGEREVVALLVAVALLV